MPSIADLFPSSNQAQSEQNASGERFRVIDGDTFQMAGEDGSMETYRVAGMDTPEQANIGGQEGTEVLRSFLQRGIESGEIEVIPGERDRHGRRLAEVRVGGQDYGAYLMQEGRGVPAYDDTYRNVQSVDPETLPEEQRQQSQEQFERAYQIEGLSDLMDPGLGYRNRGSTFERAVTRGKDQMLAGFHALTGQDEKVRADRARMMNNPAEVGSVRDIENLGDFSTWFTELVGEEAPGFALDLSSFVGGLGVGGVLGMGARRTATAATLGSLIEQSAGEVAVDLEQDDQIGLGERLAYSAGAGTAMGALDLLSMGRVVTDASRALGIRNPRIFSDSIAPLMGNSRLQNRLANVVATSGVEAGTEFAQEGISTIAKTLAKEDRLPTESEWDEFLAGDGLEALAAGAALGGAVSGTTHSVAGGTQYAWAKLAHDRELGQAEDMVDTGETPFQEPEGEQEEVPDEPVVTSPEPLSDLQAQFQDLQEGSREAFFISSSQPDDVETFKEQAGDDIHAVDNPEGTLFTRSRFIANTYANADSSELRDSMRADLLGYAQPKTEQDLERAQTVVTQDENGARVREQAVSEENVDDVVAQEQANAEANQTVSVESPIETQAYREAMIAQQEEEDALALQQAETETGQEQETSEEVGEQTTRLNPVQSELMTPEEINEISSEPTEQPNQSNPIVVFGEDDSALQEDIVTRALRESDQAEAEIRKYYSRGFERKQDVQEVVKQLRRQSPSVRFNVREQDGRSYIGMEKKTFGTMSGARREADRLNERTLEQMGVLYVPSRENDQWVLAAHSVSSEMDDTAVARQFLPRAIALGHQARLSNNRNQYILMRDSSGQVGPIHTKTLTGWGRRSDDTVQGEAGSIQNNRRWFNLGLANAQLMGFTPIESEVDSRGNLRFNKDIAAAGRSDVSQQRESRRARPVTEESNEVQQARENVRVRQDEINRRNDLSRDTDSLEFVNQLEELRRDDYLSYRERLIYDDEAFAAMEDSLDTDERIEIAAERNLQKENNGMLGIDPLAESQDGSTQYVERHQAQKNFYSNVRRGLMRSIASLRYQYRNGSENDRLELMSQLTQLTDQVSKIDQQLTDISRHSAFGVDAFNRKKKGKEGEWVDAGRPYDGTVPFWFMQQARSKKVGDHAVVFGKGDATPILESFRALSDDAPNVVVAFGKSLPNEPAFQKMNEILTLEGGKGRVIYDAGSDFAMVYVDGRLGEVEKKAVLAHELSHIYVEHALGKLQTSDPEAYARTMAWMKKKANAENQSVAREWLVNQAALNALGNTAQMKDVPTPLKSVVAWVRRFMKKIRQYLGQEDESAQALINRIKKEGLFDGVSAGSLSPFANQGHAHFTTTANQWGGGRLTKLYDNIREISRTMARGTAPIWQTSDGRLRRMGRVGREIADMFWLPPGKRGNKQHTNMITQRVSDARTWDSTFNRVKEKLGEQFTPALNEYFNAAEGTPREALSASAQQVFDFFDRFYNDYLGRRMPTLGRIQGKYSTTIYDPERVQEGYSEFVDTLVDSGHYNSAEASAIADSIINMQGFHDPELEEILNEKLVTGAVQAWSSKNRRITDSELIKTLRESGFMLKDNELATRHYIWQMTKRAAMENVMGDYMPIPIGERWSETNAQNLSDFIRRSRSRYLVDNANRIALNSNSPQDAYQRIKEFAMESRFLRQEPMEDGTTMGFTWYHPTGRLRESLLTMQQSSPDQAREAYSIVQAYLGRVGLDMDPAMRKIQGRIATYQAYTTLAFSAVASLPDLMGPILRMRRLDYMVPAMRDAFRAMVNYKNTDADARAFGFGSERMDHIQVLEMYGLQFQDALSQEWSNRLFKWNGQTAFTHMTRAVSLEVGKRAMLRAEHDAYNGTDKEKAAAREFLEQFDLRPDQIREWRENGLITSQDIYEGRAEGYAAENAEGIHSALQRFVDESIIRPNAALRPTWASNPKYMLLWQLKSFFYAYGKVVVKPFLDASIQRIRSGDISGGLAPYLVAVPGLLLLSFLGMQLRDGIQKLVSAAVMAPMALVSDEWKEEIGNIWGNSYFDNMSSGEYAFEMLRRTGVFGPWELLMNASEDRPVESRVGGLLGPAPQQGLELTAGALSLAGDMVTSPFGDGQVDSPVAKYVLRAIPGVNQLSSFKGAVYNLGD